MKVSIKEKININLKKKLNEVCSYEALVGINERDAQKKKTYFSYSEKNGKQLKVSKDVTLGEVAAIHEFGDPSNNIPERSFLRDTLEIKKDEIINNIKEQIETAIKSKSSAKMAVKAISNDFLNKVQERILDGIEPQLSSETVERKGHDLQLVDTDQLFDSIKSSVNKKGVSS